jgi:hypothetical protein
MFVSVYNFLFGCGRWDMNAYSDPSRMFNKVNAELRRGERVLDEDRSGKVVER